MLPFKGYSLFRGLTVVLVLQNIHGRMMSAVHPSCTVSGNKAIFRKKTNWKCFSAVLSLKIKKEKKSDRCCKAVYIENGLANGFLFECTDALQGTFNILAPELFFLILAHPVYKM